MEFLTEITNWITDVVTQDTNLPGVGDFNLHINNENDENAANFMELMVALGLMQHATGPTLKCGNILDLSFTENFSEIDIHSCILGNLLSDHYMINCRTSFKCQEICHRDINYYDLASIDLELIAEDIKPGIMNGDTLDTQVEKTREYFKGNLENMHPYKLNQ